MLDRKLEDIDKIITHCSDSDVKAHDDIAVVREWHLDRGFSEVGYNFFIKDNGEIQKGRDLGLIGAHCRRHNLSSVGICLHGRHELPSPAQKIALQALISSLRMVLCKDLKVYAHNHFDENKTCPNFDVEFLNQCLD